MEMENGSNVKFLNSKTASIDSIVVKDVIQTDPDLYDGSMDICSHTGLTRDDIIDLYLSGKIVIEVKASNGEIIGYSVPYALNGEMSEMYFMVYDATNKSGSAYSVPGLFDLAVRIPVSPEETGAQEHYDPISADPIDDDVVIDDGNPNSGDPHAGDPIDTGDPNSGDPIDTGDPNSGDPDSGKDDGDPIDTGNP